MPGTEFFMLNYQEELNLLEVKGLRRSLRGVDSACGRYIKVDGRRLLNFSSNNYLGLASDTRLKKAASMAIKKFGVGSGASRLISGNTIKHRKLEERIARFKKQEAALVFPTGYCANLGIISALARRDDFIFSDRLNHASIIDGIILSRAKLIRYPHKDTLALEELLKKAESRTPNPEPRRRFIITDSVFSMDGDIAPIRELLRLAEKYDCCLIIDDAHATGVLGKTGAGALEHFGITASDRIIQMGTLSKAVGCLGGFVAGSQGLIDYFINYARTFIFTTALPASVVAAAKEGIEIIEKDAFLRKKLLANADFLREGLRILSFNTLGSQTPIIPVLIKDPRITVEFSKRFFKEGILALGVRPPTVPLGTSRLRLTVMATHTREDLEWVLKSFRRIGKKLGII